MRLVDALSMLRKSEIEQLRTTASLHRMDIYTKTELQIVEELLATKLEVIRYWSTGNGRDLNVMRGVCSQLRRDIVSLQASIQLLGTCVGHVSAGLHVQVRRNSRTNLGNARSVRHDDIDSESDTNDD